MRTEAIKAQAKPCQLPAIDALSDPEREARVMDHINRGTRALMGLRAIAELLESHGQPYNAGNYVLGDDFSCDLACLLEAVSDCGRKELEGLFSEMHGIGRGKAGVA